MSPNLAPEPASTPTPAIIFAALGDPTRLSLVERLRGSDALSIAHLTEGHGLTRQAISKHLHVLEQAGLVRGERQGRENLYRLEPAPLLTLRAYLEMVAGKWDDALGRLERHLASQNAPEAPEAQGQDLPTELL